MPYAKETDDDMHSTDTAMELIGKIPIFRIFNIHVIFICLIDFSSLDIIFVNVNQMALFWKCIFIKILNLSLLSSESSPTYFCLLDSSPINFQLLMLLL